MKKAIVALTLVFVSLSSFAAVDGFYSSVNEIDLILKKSSEVREHLGTAYRIESIVSRPDRNGYLISASNNRDQICTLDIEVVKTADSSNYMNPPLLSLKYNSVTCR